MIFILRYTLMLVSFLFGRCLLCFGEWHFVLSPDGGLGGTRSSQGLLESLFILSWCFADFLFGFQNSFIAVEVDCLRYKNRQITFLSCSSLLLSAGASALNVLLFFLCPRFRSWLRSCVLLGWTSFLAFLWMLIEHFHTLMSSWLFNTFKGILIRHDSLARVSIQKDLPLGWRICLWLRSNIFLITANKTPC